jgi:hypothetical protein
MPKPVRSRIRSIPASTVRGLRPLRPGLLDRFGILGFLRLLPVLSPPRDGLFDGRGDLKFSQVLAANLG